MFHFVPVNPLVVSFLLILDIKIGSAFNRIHRDLNSRFIALLARVGHLHFVNVVFRNQSRTFAHREWGIVEN